MAASLVETSALWNDAFGQEERPQLYSSLIPDQDGFQPLNDPQLFTPDVAKLTQEQIHAVASNNTEILKEAQNEYLEIQNMINAIQGKASAKNPQDLPTAEVFEEIKESKLYGYKYEKSKPALINVDGDRVKRETVSEQEKSDVRLYQEPFEQGGFIPTERQYKSILAKAKDPLNPDGWKPFEKNGKHLIPKQQKYRAEYTYSRPDRHLNLVDIGDARPGTADSLDSALTPSKGAIQRRLGRTRFGGLKVPPTREVSEAPSTTSTPRGRGTPKLSNATPLARSGIATPDEEPDAKRHKPNGFVSLHYRKVDKTKVETAAPSISKPLLPPPSPSSHYPKSTSVQQQDQPKPQNPHTMSNGYRYSIDRFPEPPYTQAALSRPSYPQLFSSFYQPPQREVGTTPMQTPNNTSTTKPPFTNSPYFPAPSNQLPPPQSQFQSQHLVQPPNQQLLIPPPQPTPPSLPPNWPPNPESPMYPAYVTTMRARKWTNTDLLSALAHDHSWLHPGNPREAARKRSGLERSQNPVRSLSMYLKWQYWDREGMNKRPRRAAGGLDGAAGEDDEVNGFEASDEVGGGENMMIDGGINGNKITAANGNGPESARKDERSTPRTISAAPSIQVDTSHVIGATTIPKSVPTTPIQQQPQPQSSYYRTVPGAFHPEKQLVSDTFTKSVPTAATQQQQRQPQQRDYSTVSSAVTPEKRRFSETQNHNSVTTSNTTAPERTPIKATPIAPVASPFTPAGPSPAPATTFRALQNGLYSYSGERLLSFGGNTSPGTGSGTVTATGTSDRYSDTVPAVTTARPQPPAFVPTAAPAISNTAISATAATSAPPTTSGPSATFPLAPTTPIRAALGPLPFKDRFSSPKSVTTPQQERVTHPQYQAPTLPHSYSYSHDHRRE